MGSFATKESTAKCELESEYIPQIMVKLQMQYILCHWVRKQEITGFPDEIIRSIIDNCIFITIFDLEHEYQLKYKNEPKPKFLSKRNGECAKNNYDYLFKFTLIGDSNCGKSSLLKRYCDNSFTQTTIHPIGADFKIKTLKIDNKIVKLQIWDVGNGQQKFRSVSTAYYRGTHGFIIVYDVTDKESFENVVHWNRQIERHANHYVHKILIGTKSDLIGCNNNEIVSLDKAATLCKQLKIHHCVQTASKTGENVNNAFYELANGLYTYYVKRTFMPWCD